MQGISLRNGSNFGFVGGLKNNSEMKRNKAPVRQGNIYTSEIRVTKIMKGR